MIRFLNEKQDIAEACNQYFASVGNKLTDQIQPSQDNPIRHIPVGKERFLVQTNQACQSQYGTRQIEKREGHWHS